MAQEEKKSYVVFGVWNIMIQDYFAHRGDFLEVQFQETSGQPQYNGILAFVDNPFTRGYFNCRGTIPGDVVKEFWDTLRLRCYAAFVLGVVDMHKALLKFFNERLRIHFSFDNNLIVPLSFCDRAGAVSIEDGLRNARLFDQWTSFYPYRQAFMRDLDELTTGCHRAGYKYACIQMFKSLLDTPVTNSFANGTIQILKLAPTREEVDKATEKL